MRGTGSRSGCHGCGTGFDPRVERLIINLDTALPLACGWDDCDRRARTPYQVRVHEHLGACTSEIALVSAR